MPQIGTISGTALETPTCVGGWIEHPFRDEGDSVTKLYAHRMQVLATSYAPLSDDDTMTSATQKPVRSPFSDDANAFYVGDSQPSPVDGGMVEFVRTFANVPQDRIETNGFYAYSRPGIDFGITFSVYNSSWKTGNSTSKSFTNSPEPRITLTIPSSPARGDIFAVGNKVNVYNANSWDFDSGEGTTQVFAGTILSKSVNTFTINGLQHLTGSAGATNPVVSIDSDNGATNYQLWLALRERAQANINVASFSQLSYVKTSSPESIGLVNAIEISDGQLTNNTTPDITEYLDLIYDNDTVQIEPETIDRWRGNIYVKRKIVGKVPIHQNFAF